MILPFGITIFISAFLLFQVQPLIGKYILPWFGGSPGVWTTCMLFFQLLLLGGYAYAHLSTRLLKPRTQAVVHGVLLLLALALLPITPAESWKPQSLDNPTWHILALLTVSIGLPYFVISSTGPLMQEWFSMLRPGVSPYRLYALSNVGSLLALVSYPFYFEPAFTRKVQAGMWGAGLAAYALACGVCAMLLYRKSLPASPANSSAAESAEPVSAPATGDRLLWLGLPACASAVLLATTNKICQDVAVIPFLWVLPLALYLLTFIICFDSPRWYRRWPYVIALIASLAWVCFALFQGGDISIRHQLAAYSLTLFLCCMVCHGELYRIKPHPRNLTAYYLMISAGGALGGIFVALVAPFVFDAYYELHWSLWACAVLTMVVCIRHRSGATLRSWTLPAWPFLAIVVFGLGAALWVQAWQANRDTVLRTRNFYGALAIFEYSKDDPDSHYFLLQHGKITHGLQFVDPELALRPTSYYTEGSGVALAFQHFPRATNRRIGVVGLGTGTTTALARGGDYVRIYEINSAVHRLATNNFTYLKHCPGKVEVVMGDARLSMEHEPPQNFDILALDAFSSDAIPVHLLTKEAFEIYERHLRPDGVIAVHVSNRYLNLEPVVETLAHEFSYQTAIISFNDEKQEDWWIYSSTWILVTKNKELLRNRAVSSAISEPEDTQATAPLWTDDYASLFPILKK